MAVIYIVDDDENNRLLLTHILCAHQAVPIVSGVQLLSLLAKGQRPDLILLDQRMPVMDGLMVLQQLSQQYPLLKCVMISAEHQFELAIEAMRLGAIDFIHKPFEASVIRQRIEQALNHVVLLKEKNDIEMRLRLEQERYQQRLEEEIFNKTKDAQIALAQSIKANKAKDEFIANMTHELKTPIHGIRSFSKLGIDRIDRLEKVKLIEYFQQIETCSDRLLKLVNQLLTQAKLESNANVLDLQLVNMGDLIGQVLVSIDSILVNKAIRVEVDLNAAGDLIVSIDRDKMVHVIENLILNAVKFSPIGGCIRIECAQRNDRFYCAIKDEGPGIPPDEVAIIFEPFVQSSLTKTGAGGVGLGLSIAKGIVIAHAGEIEATNNSDKGACFRFNLPIQQIK